MYSNKILSDFVTHDFVALHLKKLLNFAKTCHKLVFLSSGKIEIVNGGDR